MLPRIKIMRVPLGNVFPSLRNEFEWVGLALPCLFMQENSRGKFEIGPKMPVVPFDVYVVLQEDAIEALSKSLPVTAKWWRGQGYPEFYGALFIFKADTVKEIDIVPHRRLVNPVNLQPTTHN